MFSFQCLPRFLPSFLFPSPFFTLSFSVSLSLSLLLFFIFFLCLFVFPFYFLLFPCFSLLILFICFCFTERTTSKHYIRERKSSFLFDFWFNVVFFPSSLFSLSLLCLLFKINVFFKTSKKTPILGQEGGYNKTVLFFLSPVFCKM